MKFLVWRASRELGTFTEEEFRAGIFRGEIVPTDVYCTDPAAGFKSVAEYKATMVMPPPLPIPATPRQSEAATAPEKKQGSPASPGGGLAILAVFAPLLHESLFFLVSLPCLLAAFVLAIVSIARGKIVGGVALLGGLFIATMLSFLMLTDGKRMLADPQRYKEEVTREKEESDRARAARDARRRR